MCQSSRHHRQRSWWHRTCCLGRRSCSKCCRCSSWYSYPSISRDSIVPRVSVHIPGLDVQPAPVGINNDLAVLGCAATLCSARLPCHSRVSLGLLCAHELAPGQGKERSGEDKSAIHGGEERATSVLTVSSLPADGGLSTSRREDWQFVLFASHGPEGADSTPNDCLRIAICH